MPLISTMLPPELYASGLGEAQAAIVRSSSLRVPLRLPAGQAPPLTFLQTPATRPMMQPIDQLPPAAAAAAAASRPPAVPNLVPAVAYSTKEKEPLAETLKRAGKRALGGGVPGAAAMAVQVRTLCRAARLHARVGGCPPSQRQTAQGCPHSRSSRPYQMPAGCYVCSGCGGTSWSAVGAQRAVCTCRRQITCGAPVPQRCQPHLRPSGPHLLSTFRCCLSCGCVPQSTISTGEAAAAVLHSRLKAPRASALLVTCLAVLHGWPFIPGRLLLSEAAAWRENLTRDIDAQAPGGAELR